MVSYTALVMRVWHFRRSDLAAAHALAGVSDPMFWISHSREVHHSEKHFHCVSNKPVQFKILVVIIRKYKRYITTYNSRLIFRLLPIVSLVYSGVSHITVGETITKWCSELKPVWFFVTLNFIFTYQRA